MILFTYGLRADGVKLHYESAFIDALATDYELELRHCLDVVVRTVIFEIFKRHGATTIIDTNMAEDLAQTLAETFLRDSPLGPPSHLDPPPQR